MSIWQRIKCRLGYHEFYKIKRVSPSTLHIGCRCCRREWGMNSDVRALLPWSEVEGFYSDPVWLKAQEFRS